MKFYIAIEEKRSTVVEVEAGCVDEAYRKAEKAYCNGLIDMDSSEFIDDGGQQFIDETETWGGAIDNGYAVDFQKIE